MCSLGKQLFEIAYGSNGTMRADPAVNLVHEFGLGFGRYLSRQSRVNIFDDPPYNFFRSVVLVV
jgi:hypothetical protein